MGRFGYDVGVASTPSTPISVPPSKRPETDMERILREAPEYLDKLRREERDHTMPPGIVQTCTCHCPVHGRSGTLD